MNKILKGNEYFSDMQLVIEKESADSRIHFYAKTASGSNYGGWNGFATFWPKGIEKYPNNFACLNENYVSEITEWIEKNKLGKFTGKYIDELPLFEWDENELKKYEFQWRWEKYLKNVTCGYLEREFTSSVEKKSEDEYIIHLKKI